MINGTKLTNDVEMLLSGLYNIYTTKACQLNYLPAFKSFGMSDDEKGQKDLEEIVYYGQTIEVIADMIYNGFSVKLKNRQQRITIFERVEQYLKIAKNTYSIEFMSDEFKLKLSKLNNLCDSLLDNNKAHIVSSIVNDIKQQDAQQGYVDFATPEVSEEQTLAEYERTNKDIFKDIQLGEL